MSLVCVAHPLCPSHLSPYLVLLVLLWNSIPSPEVSTIISCCYSSSFLTEILTECLTLVSLLFSRVPFTSPSLPLAWQLIFMCVDSILPSILMALLACDRIGFPPFSSLLEFVIA